MQEIIDSKESEFFRILNHNSHFLLLKLTDFTFSFKRYINKQCILQSHFHEFYFDMLTWIFIILFIMQPEHTFDPFPLSSRWREKIQLSECRFPWKKLSIDIGLNCTSVHNLKKNKMKFPYIWKMRHSEKYRGRVVGLERWEEGREGKGRENKY